MQALTIALVLWIAALTGMAVPGDRFVLTNQVKGADFVQFYTLAHVAFEGAYPGLDEAQRVHSRQVELIPASADGFFLPVYPPTAALLMAPLRGMPYRVATFVWAGFTAFGYALLVWLLWRPNRHVFADRWFVVAAAAAFPPFWWLILYGQTTIIPAAGFALFWWGLEARRPVLAGFAAGLIALKPQFGLVFACVMLLTGQWRIVLGCGLSVALQVAAVLMTWGPSALVTFADTVKRFPEIAPLVQPHAFRTHSLRTITSLLPGPLDWIVWMSAAIFIIISTVRVWRAETSNDARIGMLVLASIIINPHVYIYDLTVMIIPIFLFAGWVERAKPQMRDTFWQLLYLVYVFTLFPTARLIGIQASVLLMLWLFMSVSRALRADALPRAVPA